MAKAFDLLFESPQTPLQTQYIIDRIIQNMLSSLEFISLINIVNVFFK